MQTLNRKPRFRTAFKLITVAGMISLSTFYGCKKDIKGNSDDVSPTKARSAGDGKNDLLGYGYDVTGEYANSSASTFAVFDADALRRDYPTRVEWDLSSRQEGTLTAGEDAESYLKKKSLKVNASVGVGLFKGSISASYSNSDAFSSKYVYSSFDLVVQQKRVKINADIDLLKKYLHSTFIYDVNNGTPQTIIKKYGTHVLTDIILGAKLEILYRSQTDKSNRAQAAEAGVDISVGKVFSINTGVNAGYSDSSVKSNFKQSLHYKTYGGEPSKSLMGDIPIGADVPKVNIKDWQASSSVDNAELVDFGRDGLIPLYEFIDDPLKKEAVKTYTNQYLKDNAVVLLDEVYARIVYDNFRWPGDDQKQADVYIKLYDRDKRTLKATTKEITITYAMSMTTQPTPPSYIDYEGWEKFQYFKGTVKIPAGQNTVRILKDIYVHTKGGFNTPPFWIYYISLPSDGFQPLNDTWPW
ncbi:hypothetical protein HHL17_32660 [Chitinophaga sp. G-6-1-13]|uniref:MACPF domain-containing protein n=1 Tax=Chitinophaga fulva TaxID=2728842 RepID=A0A848GZJ6_9BACT|nr:MAC/perforin domain-containing protein [Chitinophaga fulva]NML41983.1 hypothetical protein [Chitinophaga fulva]